MKRKHLLVLIALVSILALCLSACGGKDAPSESLSSSAEAPLGLGSWELSASPWSSPNGATIHLKAVPSRFAEGDTAQFVVRLEGEDVASADCTFADGSYTASVDLNGQDGYCYYVLLAGADGTRAEVPVNTPAQITDETLVNLASSLDSYCTATVDSSAFADGKLTLSAGSALVQLPKLTNAGETITCTDARLTLTHNGEMLMQHTVPLTAADESSQCHLDLAGSTFSVPALEDDQQLHMNLDVTLSNGQILTSRVGTWIYSAGELLAAVG